MEIEHAQVEIEALAVTWSCKKFTNLLIRLPRFTAETNHKLLLATVKVKATRQINSKSPTFPQETNEILLRYHIYCKKNFALYCAPGSIPVKQDIQ